MAVRRSEPAVVARPTVRPVMRSGRPFCPRCGSGLQRDYEVLVCIACGYEFVVAANDPEWRGLLGPRRAAAMLPLLIGARLSPWLMIAAISILTIVALVGRAGRRRRATSEALAGAARGFAGR